MLCLDFISFVCAELGTYLCQVNLTEMIRLLAIKITSITTMRHIFKKSMTDDSVVVLFQRIPSGMSNLSLTSKGKLSHYTDFVVQGRRSVSRMSSQKLQPFGTRVNHFQRICPQKNMCKSQMKKRRGLATCQDSKLACTD